MPVKVFERSGPDNDWAERTWAELVAEFGPVEIRSAPETSAYRVAELYISGDDAPATITVTVKDKDGNPVRGVPVVWSWPDAQRDLSLGWDGKGAVGPTNDEGKVGFSLGRGGFYFPPEKGPHAIWITGGDYIGGLGMLGRTNHKHIDVVYQFVPAAEPQPQPNPYEPTALGVMVFDAEGYERDADWLYSQYGRVEVHRGATVGYCVTTLQEAHGGPLVVRLLDELALPAAGVEVVLRARAGTGGGQTAITDGHGKAEFALSNVHKYSAPGEQGPFLAVARDAASDAVFGLGWVRNTDRHLNVTMGWDDCDEDEPDTDPDPDTKLLGDLLGELAGLMEEVLGVIGEIQEELD